MTYSVSLFAYLYHFELPTEWAQVMYAHVWYCNSLNFTLSSLENIKIISVLQLFNGLTEGSLVGVGKLFNGYFNYFIFMFLSE